MKKKDINTENIDIKYETPYEEVMSYDRVEQCEYCRYDIKYKYWRCQGEFWSGKSTCSKEQQNICPSAKRNHKH